MLNRQDGEHTERLLFMCCAVLTEVNHGRGILITPCPKCGKACKPLPDRALVLEPVDRPGDPPLDHLALAIFQDTIVRDEEQRFRAFLGDEVRAVYDCHVKQMAALREAMVRSFTESDMLRLSEAASYVCQYIGPVLLERRIWLRWRTRFATHDVQPMRVATGELVPKP